MESNNTVPPKDGRRSTFLENQPNGLESISTMPLSTIKLHRIIKGNSEGIITATQVSIPEATPVRTLVPEEKNRMIAARIASPSTYLPHL